MSNSTGTKLFQCGSEPLSQTFDFSDGSDLHLAGNPRATAYKIDTRRTRRVTPDQKDAQQDAPIATYSAVSDVTVDALTAAGTRVFSGFVETAKPPKEPPPDIFACHMEDEEDDATIRVTLSQTASQQNAPIAAPRAAPFAISPALARAGEFVDRSTSTGAKLFHCGSKLPLQTIDLAAQLKDAMHELQEELADTQVQLAAATEDVRYHVGHHDTPIGPYIRTGALSTLDGKMFDIDSNVPKSNLIAKRLITELAARGEVPHDSAHIKQLRKSLPPASRPPNTGHKTDYSTARRKPREEQWAWTRILPKEGEPVIAIVEGNYHLGCEHYPSQWDCRTSAVCGKIPKNKRIPEYPEAKRYLKAARLADAEAAALATTNLENQRQRRAGSPPIPARGAFVDLSIPPGAKQLSCLKLLHPWLKSTSEAFDTKASRGPAHRRSAAPLNRAATLFLHLLSLEPHAAVGYVVVFFWTILRIIVDPLIKLLIYCTLALPPRILPLVCLELAAFLSCLYLIGRTTTTTTPYTPKRKRQRQRSIYSRWLHSWLKSPNAAFDNMTYFIDRYIQTQRQHRRRCASASRGLVCRSAAPRHRATTILALSVVILGMARTHTHCANSSGPATTNSAVFDSDSLDIMLDTGPTATTNNNLPDCLVPLAETKRRLEGINGVSSNARLIGNVKWAILDDHSHHHVIKVPGTHSYPMCLLFPEHYSQQTNNFHGTHSTNYGGHALFVWHHFTQHITMPLSKSSNVGILLFVETEQPHKVPPPEIFACQVITDDEAGHMEEEDHHTSGSSAPTGSGGEVTPSISTDPGRCQSAD